MKFSVCVVCVVCVLVSIGCGEKEKNSPELTSTEIHQNALKAADICEARGQHVRAQILRSTAHDALQLECEAKKVLEESARVDAELEEIFASIEEK